MNLTQTNSYGKKYINYTRHHFENFINQKIRSGKYNSVSKVIHSALRLLEKEENKVDLLISEMEAGEKSGLIEDFNPKEFLTSLKKGHL